MLKQILSTSLYNSVVDPFVLFTSFAFSLYVCCMYFERILSVRVLQVCEYPDGTKSLKLGDFGLATVVEGPLYTVCGTPTYVAPEIIAETG